MHHAFKVVFATAAALVSIAATAAGPGGHFGATEIDERQARQEQRIERLLARGELSRREYRTLRRGQEAIARVEAQALADGRLGRREMRQLSSMLDEADAQIRLSRQQRG